MRKTELYQSIDSIKQDDELKERILTAVEERDKIVVIKRPVFVPVMIALLLCLNIGMMARLVINNKSQVNMAEFKARTTLSSISPTTNQSMESIIQGTDDMENEFQNIKENLFQNEKKKFIQELEYNDYNIVNEWSSDEMYDIQSTLPWYKDNGDTLLNSGDYTFRRYVEVIVLNENASKDEGCIYSLNSYDEETKCGEFNIAYTNHEYIIGYDGQGYDFDNIISITESDITNKSYDKERIKEASVIDAGTYKEAIRIRVSDIALGNGDIVNDSIYPLGLYLMFPSKSFKNDNCIFYEYMAEKLVESPNYMDIAYQSIELKFLMTPNGKDVTDKFDNYEDYWKETVYSTQKSVVKKVTVPDVVGMSIEEAKAELEKVGLTITSRTYEYPENTETKYNNVISCSPSAGDRVCEGSGVYLSICGKMVPQVYGMSIEEAVKELENMGLKAEMEYAENIKPDDSGLYVYRTTPYVGTGMTSSDTVTLHIAGPDTYIPSSLLGCVINLDMNDYYYRKFYSREETKELIKGKEKGEEHFIDALIYGFEEYCNNTNYFVGTMYDDDLFYIEGFKSDSNIGYSIPYLQCGMDKSMIDKVLEEDYYKERKATLEQDEISKILQYDYDEEKKVKARIYVNDGLIESMHVRLVEQ